MKTEEAFQIDHNEYSIHQLLLEDLPAVQAIFEKCLDYMLLIDGHPADPSTVAEEFKSVPAGKAAEDKFVFGIVNCQNLVVGMLDTLRGYPNENSWWIDTLLLIPDVRSQGVGARIVKGFSEYVHAQGGETIMLGVVDENRRAYQFWQRMGFELVRKTEPQQFGHKTQTVSIMRRRLANN